MLWTLAEIQNNKVVNVILCEEENANIFPGYIRVDNLTPQPGPGWSYVNGVFTPPGGVITPPPPPPPPPPKTVFTKFEFRSRFTFNELVAVDNFAANGALTADQKAALTTITKNFDAAGSIDLTNQTTIQGVDYLATAGIITADRAKQILTPV